MRTEPNIVRLVIFRTIVLAALGFVVGLFVLAAFDPGYWVAVIAAVFVGLFVALDPYIGP